MKIRVLVCDDMLYMCMFFSSLLNSSEECACVGEAHNEEEAISKVKELMPDVVLLDMQMEHVDSGIKLIPQIQEISPDIHIIMISIHGDDDKIFQAIRAGARDYIMKNQPPGEILDSIVKAYNGKAELRTEIAQKLIKQCEVMEKRQNSIIFVVDKMMGLSAREMEVLKAACRGLSYEQIADQLCVEDVTVRTYVGRILKKMQCTRMKNLVDNLNSLGILQLFNDEND